MPVRSLAGTGGTAVGDLGGAPPESCSALGGFISGTVPVGAEAARACAIISLAFLVSSTTVDCICGTAGPGLGAGAFGFWWACPSAFYLTLCFPIRTLSLSFSLCLVMRWLLT